MENKPKISDAEWQVMNVLWSMPNCTANEVVKALSDKKPWKPKTVKTLLNRLVGKKAVAFNKKGRSYLYFPLLNEEECIHAETRSLIERIPDGGLKPMLAAFIDAEQLSKEDIAELKDILERKGEMK